MTAAKCLAARPCFSPLPHRDAGQAQDEISSGLIVSTGAARVAAWVTGLEVTLPGPESYRLPWEAGELYFNSGAVATIGLAERRARPIVRRQHSKLSQG